LCFRRNYLLDERFEARIATPFQLGEEVAQIHGPKVGKHSAKDFSTRNPTPRPLIVRTPSADYGVLGDSLSLKQTDDFGTRLCARKISTWGMWLADGCVCPRSQFKTVVLSQPIIFATSFCSNPKSSRRLRIASPIVLIALGYALSFGFFPLNRTRQKSNATSGAHCHRKHELAKSG
jgi:hypothetical protein